MENSSAASLGIAWYVFVSMFSGDHIPRGASVRRIKLFDCLALVFISYASVSMAYSPYPRLTLEHQLQSLLLYISVFWIYLEIRLSSRARQGGSLDFRVMWKIFTASYVMIFIGPGPR